MADSSLDLQKAIVAALKASAELTALVGSRIYDQAPANAVKPYVSLGPEDWIAADGVGIVSYAGSVQIDVWSGATGKPEAKRIANAVQNALHLAPLTLDSAQLVLLAHRITRYFVEADGLTKHGALDFRATTKA